MQWADGREHPLKLFGGLTPEMVNFHAARRGQQTHTENKSVLANVWLVTLRLRANQHCLIISFADV